MASDRFLVSVLFFFISVFLKSASASFISDSILDSRASAIPSRTLLQAKKSCPINFEFQNYTIITSQCKGPQYSRQHCCDSFKEFACPFTDELNDVSNDCASTMFSYINLYGKYPPGLFASFCQEGKEGLACNVTTSVSDSNANSGQMVDSPSPHLILFAVGFLLFFQMF